jgi:hypothetical protein
MTGGGWSNGADVRLTLARASGPELVLTGRIDAGSRASVIDVPADAIGAGPWRIDVRVSATTAGRAASRAAANDGPYDSGVEIESSDGQLIGAPMAFRATPSPRSVPKPVADFQYRRVERLHVEWPVVRPLDSTLARLLDRQGEPLPLTPVVSDGTGEAAGTVMVDLPLSALSEGEYVIELTATGGTQTERKLMAFRVVR